MSCEDEIGKVIPISPADFNKLSGKKVNDVIRAINEYLMREIRKGDVSKINISTAVVDYNDLSVDIALSHFLDQGWICERDTDGNLFLLSEEETENPIQNAIAIAHGEDSAVVEDSQQDSNQDSVLADSNAEPGDSQFLTTTVGP
jgi:hypothetical protein